jgi:hypothetical protein
MFSNPSPYGLSISVESVLSIYVEHVSQNWIVKSPDRIDFIHPFLAVIS